MKSNMETNVNNNRKHDKRKKKEVATTTVSIRIGVLSHHTIH